jgi:hypothetical protein
MLLEGENATQESLLPKLHISRNSAAFVHPPGRKAIVEVRRRLMMKLMDAY